jgi:hypothetical protein
MKLTHGCITLTSQYSDMARYSHTVTLTYINMARYSHTATWTVTTVEYVTLPSVIPSGQSLTYPDGHRHSKPSGETYLHAIVYQELLPPTTTFTTRYQISPAGTSPFGRRYETTLPNQSTTYLNPAALPHRNRTHPHNQ